MLPVVVKVGGSLFDLRHLGPRLCAFVKALEGVPILLVPGGGRLVDIVRDLDRKHDLGEEASHWLSLRCLTLNARFLAGLLPSAEVIEDPCESESVFGRGKLPILDGLAFARADERSHPELALPHRWTATSDSLAARAAHVAKANRLILLKSTTMRCNANWSEAARTGLVDETFPAFVGRDPGMQIRSINLREWTP